MKYYEEIFDDIAQAACAPQTVVLLAGDSLDTALA